MGSVHQWLFLDENNMQCGTYEFFFAWRDRLYAEYRQPVDKASSNNFGGGVVNEM